MRQRALVLVLLLGTGCASSSVSLISNTPAQVMLGSGQSDSAKPLGKTPLSLDLNELQTQSRFVRLSFQAEEYETLDVVIPKSYSDGKLQVQLSKKEKYTPAEYREKIKKDTENSYKKIYRDIITEVLRIQSALMKNDLPMAKSLIAKLDKNFVHASVVYLIEGHLALIEGRRPAALANYEKALKEEIQSPELVTMVETLRATIQSQSEGRVAE